MTKKVLFISEAQVKAQSLIESNADSKMLAKIIMNVQETQLKAILGKTLFNSLAEIIYSAGTSEGYVIEPNMKILLDDYINPYLVFATLVDFTVLNNYKQTNKGTLKLNDDGAASASNADIEYVKNYYENYLTQYKKNLLDYLETQNLLDVTSDTNLTSSGIGWFLDDGLYSTKNWNKEVVNVVNGTSGTGYTTVLKPLTTGSNTIIQIDKTLYKAAWFDYVLYNGVNQRTGTIAVTNNENGIAYYETSTTDVGDTSAINASVVSNTSTFDLIFSGVPDSTYILKTIYRLL